MKRRNLSAFFLLLALCARGFGGSPLRSVEEAQSITAVETDGPVAFDLTGTSLGYSRNTFFLRDGSSGIVLENKLTNGVVWTAGDLIRVRGDMTVCPNERRFAYARTLEIVGHTDLEPAVTASGRDILSGSLNFKSASVSGVIQGVTEDTLDRQYHWLILATPDGIVMASTSDKNLSENAARLVDAAVTLTGLVTPASGWRHGLAPILGLSPTNAIRIIRPVPADPFVFTSPHNPPSLNRQALKGRVVANTSNRCYLQTTSGRFVEAVPAANVLPPSPGQDVTVAGFSETDGTRLHLTEAIFRTESDLHPPSATIRDIRFSELFSQGGARFPVNTDLHGTLVRLCGRTTRALPANSADGSFGLADEDHLVTVDRSGLPVHQPPPENAIVSVTGILLAEFEPLRTSVRFPRFRNFKIVPRAPEDIQVMTRPPWWTPHRFLFAIALLLATLVAILIWNRMLNVRANRRGAELAREQLAHRAASLKIEERTRLAVEIHDAISQTLTGIALLFDSAEDGAATPSLRRFFTVARQMLASCRQELKACLWDLRTRTFEERDMTEALRRALQPYANEAKILIRFNVPRASLTETQTHDILRIVRELVINALRHGHARTVSVAGTRDGATIRFAVEDDGTGFAPESAPGPKDGHFGLQGIRERLRPHCGTLVLKPVQPHGTRAMATLSLEESENGEEQVTHPARG